MRFSADSSFVVRLYDPLADAKETAVLREYLVDDQKVISPSELCRVEVLNVLLRRPETGAAGQFESDLQLGQRLRVESVDWPDAFARAKASPADSPASCARAGTTWCWSPRRS